MCLSIACIAATDTKQLLQALTHGHGDHTVGLSVFAAAGEDVRIWAREDFNQESRNLANAGLAIQRVRGARQGGFLLDPDQRINNGIAQAYCLRATTSTNPGPTSTFRQRRSRTSRCSRRRNRGSVQAGKSISRQKPAMDSTVVRSPARIRVQNACGATAESRCSGATGPHSVNGNGTQLLPYRCQAAAGQSG